MSLAKRVIGPYTSAAKSPDQAIDSGGDGPHDDGMNERVASLEAKWESVIPTLATKSDMADLKVYFADALKNERGWMIATILTFLFGISAMIFVATSSMNATVASLKQTPLSQTAQPIPPPAQPIIIQVPATYAPAPVPTVPDKFKH